jgi:tetrahydromethanopterin S-methyltransferase subunit A
MNNMSEFSFDEKGFFVILVDKIKKKIIVEHYNYVKDKNLIKTGKINEVIEGINAEELNKKLIKKGLLSRLDHASYLGRELQKAEQALKNGLEYTQDEELKLR